MDKYGTNSLKFMVYIFFPNTWILLYLYTTAPHLCNNKFSSNCNKIIMQILHPKCQWWLVNLTGSQHRICNHSYLYYSNVDVNSYIIIYFVVYINYIVDKYKVVTNSELNSFN